MYESVVNVPQSSSTLLKAFHNICGYYGLLVIEGIVDMHEKTTCDSLHTLTQSYTVIQCGYDT